jgi:hypothetical protein
MNGECNNNINEKPKNSKTNIKVRFFKVLDTL